MRGYYDDLEDKDLRRYSQSFRDLIGAKFVARGLRRYIPHAEIHIRRGNRMVCRVTCSADSWSLALYRTMVMAEKMHLPISEDDMRKMVAMMNAFADMSRDRVDARQLLKRHPGVGYIPNMIVTRELLDMFAHGKHIHHAGNPISLVRVQKGGER